MIKQLPFLTVLLLLFATTSAYAIDTDSTKVRKNTIRWNPTPMFVVGPKSFVFGYERVLKNNQSISMNIGYLEKAPLTNEEGEVIQIFDQSSKGGFDFSLDYRFYFKKRNKYPAPDGLYWGPYTSVYQVWQDASINLLDGTAVKNTVHYNGSFTMYNLGLQLGYQFIIKDRFSIDLILMGPSYSYYDMDLKLRFDTDIDPDDPFYKELLEKISESSPLLEQFLKNQSFEASGRLKFSYYGFRYGIQLGYHF
ncbi:MAG: hypothetical protein KAG64_03285 [Bacteroidales bacterium]|nr:hypothetical protein [Bacteroidales bacterium]